MPSDISIPLSLLMKELNILNVYQINILQHLLFMFKVKNSITPKVFYQVFSLKDHLYPIIIVGQINAVQAFTQDVKRKLGYFLKGATKL